MSHIRLHRRHDMSFARARERATRMAEALRRDHGLQYDWHDSVLRFSGPALDGTLTLGDSSLDLELTLGWAMRPFRRQLEAALGARLDELLRSD